MVKKLFSWKTRSARVKMKKNTFSSNFFGPNWKPFSCEVCSACGRSVPGLTVQWIHDLKNLLKINSIMLWRFSQIILYLNLNKQFWANVKHCILGGLCRKKDSVASIIVDTKESLKTPLIIQTQSIDSLSDPDENPVTSRPPSIKYR